MARRTHSHGAVNMDICTKCGMTGLQQLQKPNRACRPPISKRRIKKGCGRPRSWSTPDGVLIVGFKTKWEYQQQWGRVFRGWPTRLGAADGT